MLQNVPESPVLRIHLWSCPRNVSTALMYSFAQRKDTQVVDEPLYAHFLRVTGVARPDRELTLSQRDADGDRVLREILEEAPVRPDGRTARVGFYKHICHQFVQLEDTWLPALGRHIVLIRHPARIIASYAKVIERPTRQDIAMERCAAMFRKLSALRLAPLVIDAADLQAEPESMLRALCAALGLDFEPAMLQWPAAARPEDGPWAKYWYGQLHESTGFLAENRPLPQLSGYAAELNEACFPFYSYLQSFALKPDHAANF